MLTILLYGFLGKRFGKVHRYAVKNPAEAIQAMCHTMKGFKQAVVDGGYYRVLRAGKSDIPMEELGFPQSSKESFRIIPVPTGSGGGGGLFTIVLGAVLIAMGQYQFLGLLAEGSTLAVAATGIGVSMVFSGISQILFSPPEVQQNQADPVENRPSYSFNGPVNATAQGNPVPICYGTVLIGSQVISAGLTIEQIPVDS